MLLFEFVGVLLLRIEERRLFSVLFQLPPRIARFSDVFCAGAPARSVTARAPPGASPSSARAPCARSKARLEKWLDHADERVMHHPVAERCRRDHALLRFGDREIEIRTGPVAAFAQFPLQPHHLALPDGKKPCARGLPALAQQRLARGRREVLERAELFPKVFVAFQKVAWTLVQNGDGTLD